MDAAGPQAGPTRRLDVTPLTEPVDARSLDAFAAESKATGKPWRQMTTGLPRPGLGDVIGQLLPAVIPLVALAFFVSVGGLSLLSAVWRFTLEAPFPLNLVVVGFFVVVVGAALAAGVQAVRLILSLRIPRWWWEAAYRLTHFAAANQLTYGHDDTVAHPGVIFGTGTERTVERRLTTTAGRRVEIGNYRYTVPGEDQKSGTVHGWGYVAITLDRRLPHLLLDAKGNDGSVFGLRRSNLPVDLAPDQKLSLGGEFDEHFTLYAPRDYGRDAFLIFAPDLMALLIDRLGAFDVEIVDDAMFVYGSRFDLLDPHTYDWLQEVVETVVTRTVRRTSRYSDDFALLQSEPGSPGSGTDLDAPTPRPAPDRSVFTLGGDPPATATNTVAEQGRRLRARRWGWASVVGLLLVAFWVYDSIVAPLFGLPTLDR